VRVAEKRGAAPLLWKNSRNGAIMGRLVSWTSRTAHGKLLLFAIHALIYQTTDVPGRAERGLPVI
jgi:hypothetical protein